MQKNLVIVESPAKAKTIEGYLGKDFKVVSSYGHVRDLPKDGLAVDVENGYLPTYEVTPDKKAVVQDLIKLSKAVETVYLASDDDREGEAISWHLKEALNLDDKKTRRIVFREITKKAIENSLKDPRGIDINLVNAQQARRVLDRLVGFELSPILWKKIKTGLSAGRVQSVAVRLVVDREREIDQFESKSSYRITAEFIVGKNRMKAELPQKLTSAKEVIDFLGEIKDARFSIRDLQTKPQKKSPAPPFTTSTLQQEASRKLGYSVARTMTLAQRLYEAGKISYMRTDSLNLSDEAKEGAADVIGQEYGKNYIKTRHFKAKSAGAQEAHEAIRPTNFNDRGDGLDKSLQRLYELIWKRTVASQMAEAVLEKTIVHIGISDHVREFVANGEVIKFDGFLKVYLESRDDDDDEETTGMLPALTIGQELDLDEIIGRETFSRPPARYTEAALVRKMEEMGIGRPSTYAPTISTIQKRDYVVKENRDGVKREYTLITLNKGKINEKIATENTGAEKNKLFPTNIAMVVNDFLVEHFPDVTNYSFTAEVEEEFDAIAHGKQQWDKMIDNFYGKFHRKVEETESLERSSVQKSREIGIDPASGKKVIARLGRFGPVVQIGENGNGDEEAEKPRYASLRNGQFIENITLEDALELFKLPRNLGEFEEKELVIGVGRFGPYIRHDNKFVSIPKEEDPYTITAERAIVLIEEKRKTEANRIIKVFESNPDIQVLNGRFGPYIKAGKKNVKIPKGKEPAELTLEECIDLAEKTPEKKKKFKKK
ncbi:MAG: type I DNA topoisomerase [Cyclobacteriaceae bacterium]|nr:type I DNA topoisomerase [Cyclobacteriaceae bacterium]